MMLHFLLSSGELEFQPSKYLPDFHVYVLEEKQTVLGFCGLIPVDDARMELRDLFLDPNYIGEGQGKRLWNLLLNSLGDWDFAR